MAREGELLWEPPAELLTGSKMARYMESLGHSDYHELWRWSVEDLEGFWSSIVDYYELPIHGDRTRVLVDPAMPGARWYPDAEVNYAEAVFRRASPDRRCRAARPSRGRRRGSAWAHPRARCSSR